VYIFPRLTRMGVGCSPSPITELASTRSTTVKFSACSSDSIRRESTQEAASASQFATGFWSSITAGFGWNHAPEPGQPSDSPYPAGSDEELGDKKDVSARKIRVLLIEDNPIDQFVITEVVKTCGFVSEIQFARDGEAALSLLKGFHESGEYPSLILLDLNLPKISGSEILHYIRSNSRYCRIPVVIVTSSDAPRDVAAIAEAGASAYFLKPTRLENYGTLREVIRDVLRSAGRL